MDNEQLNEQLIERIVRAVLRQECTKQPKFITISEASELTRFSVGSLYNMVRLRKVPFIKPEGKLLFVYDDLVEWMLSKSKAPVNENRVQIGSKLVRVR